MYSFNFSCSKALTPSALGCAQDAVLDPHLLRRDLAARLTLSGIPGDFPVSKATASPSPDLQFLGVLSVSAGARSAGDLPAVVSPCLTLRRNSQ